MANKKLSDKELQVLKGFQEKNNNYIVTLGSIEVNLDALDRQKEKILEEVQDLIKDQNEFGKELNEKYGDGNINIEKGEFTAAE
jgi:hypothetical protein